MNTIQPIASFADLKEKLKTKSLYVVPLIINDDRINLKVGEKHKIVRCVGLSVTIQFGFTNKKIELAIAPRVEYRGALISVYKAYSRYLSVEEENIYTLSLSKSTGKERNEFLRSNGFEQLCDDAKNSYHIIANMSIITYPRKKGGLRFQLLICEGQ